ncbi:MAG: transglutaminase domain-containing protein, partial [Clostridia bacterium]|nr:transglutaminase domain-containing protein [Clostridia bacterium]
MNIKTGMVGYFKRALSLMVLLCILFCSTACFNSGDGQSSVDTSNSDEFAINENSETSVEVSLGDVTPPEIIGTHFEITLGEIIDYEAHISVIDDTDPTPDLFVDNSSVDEKKPGVYRVVYKATDEAGNTTGLVLNLTIKELPTPDKTAPKVVGRDFDVAIGDTVSYKNQIIVTDNTDMAPEIKVDNSAVDLDKPGIYPVVYTVTDKSGNSTVLTLRLTVKDQASLAEMEKYVYAEAQKVLDKITNDSMTPLQKAYKIYRWTKYYNIGYVSTSDKSHWIVGAYNGFKNRRGDCFVYFAVSKALLTVAGIDNFDMAKLRTNDKDTRHYWSLVNVGDGWYHMDCTPFASSRKNANFFMVTDEELWS